MMDFGARFDWMGVTFDGYDDGRESIKLAAALGAELIPARGRNGYAQSWSVVRDGDELARVYGHSARAGEVHIESTSESCDEVVPRLREFWPAHRVARADSAVDFEADFDALDLRAVAFAQDNGISYSLITNSEGGATRYLGSRKSENYVRLYKKSEQLRALHPERAEEVPGGIVRFELEAKPGKRDTKDAVALMSADELWGLGEWTQKFAAEFLGIDAPRVSTHFRRPSDWTRVLHFLGEQYRPSVERRIAQVGASRALSEVVDALGLGVIS
jgi:hypothetical protein